MPNVKRIADVRTIALVLYTNSMRYRGQLRTNHFRFSDALNALDQDFVQLYDVTLQPLQGSTKADTHVATVLLRKDNIVIAVPWEAQAGLERAPVHQGMKVARRPLQATVEAWPFTIHGVLHLPPSGDLLQHVHDPHAQFMAVSDTALEYHPRPELSLRMPFLAVNRRRIEAVLDRTLVGQRAGTDPDVLRSPIVEEELTGVRAAELLAATAVFKGVHPPLLQAICTDLCSARRMGRKLYPAGTEVFRQGDLGDSLYVVESGKLVAYITDDRKMAEYRLADFGPGELFGEMAVLGDGRRSAAIRAATDARVVAIHAEAVKQLLQRFPLAATKLLGIMAQRRSELNSALVSFS